MVDYAANKCGKHGTVLVTMTSQAFGHMQREPCFENCTLSMQFTIDDYPNIFHVLSKNVIIIRTPLNATDE